MARVYCLVSDGFGDGDSFGRGRPTSLLRLHHKHLSVPHRERNLSSSRNIRAHSGWTALLRCLMLQGKGGGSVCRDEGNHASDDNHNAADQYQSPGAAKLAPLQGDNLINLN
jgi:hypothetical protein